MYVVPKQEKANADNDYARALFTAMVVSAIAIFAPTTALCAAMGQVWPLVLMAIVVTAGTIFGLLLHKKLEHDMAVQIPSKHVPNVPKNGMGYNFKKAA